MSADRDLLSDNPKLAAHCQGPAPGPLLVAIGQMHGNEPAGTAAVRRVAGMLERPGFLRRGTFAGLIGNSAAVGAGVRFVRQDLNRLWRPDNVERLLRSPFEKLHEDERELVKILQTLGELRDSCPPGTPLVVIDLHTTSAGGGAFALASDDPWAAELADVLGVPVVHGMLAHLEGTSMAYFTGERFPPRTAALAFEAGQHDEPASVERGTAAILRLMRALEMVAENGSGDRPGQSVNEVPRHLGLVYRHPVGTSDGFSMRPGYANFGPVKKGEPLADDRHGPVLCPADGFILMPLYQKQGSDGFFVLRPIGD
jgi:succinylglutamate desuccinylase